MHSARLGLLLVCLLFTLGEVSAQQGAKSQAKAKGESAAPASAGFSWLLPTHLLFTFETYTLKQDAFDAIHLEALPAPQLYDRVRQLTTEGKAVLESVIALPTIDGQKATSESIDEVIYGTEFDPGTAGRNYAYPTAFEMRPTGHRIEIETEPVSDKNKKEVRAAFSPDFTRFLGFDFCKGDRRVEGELQPLFISRKNTTAMPCTFDVPTLLGTCSRPKQTGYAGADGDGAVSVTFVTPRIAGPKEGKAPPESGTGNLRMAYRFYSMPRDKARDLLATTADSGELHKLVRSLPRGECKLERLIVVQARDGQPVTTEEIAENIYPTEMDPPQPVRVSRKGTPTVITVPTPPATPDGQPQLQTTTVYPDHPVYRNKEMLWSSATAFEMRPTGWRIKTLPIIKSRGMSVRLDVVPEHTEHRGNLQGPKELGRYPEQPVFATQKIKTSVNAAVGHQCFLGTMNVPHDTGVNGRKDDGRTWLAFVMVTME